MRPSDGGGSRILINPAELRRGAIRLRDVSGDLKTTAGRLRSAPTPATAPQVAEIPEAVHQLGGILDALVEPLTESAVELDRRALWTEIADQLAAGYPLTASQMAEFVAGVKDGSLVRYAEPWQAELAGRWLGQQYRDDYREPSRLIDLAHILGRNARDADFSAGFITAFGAENMANVPRIIQAMEWKNLLSELGQGRDPHLEWKLGNELNLEEYTLTEDPVALLANFSMALATATYSGKLSRQVEDELAHDEDGWAVAQLVATGTFGSHFLGEVFRSALVRQIVEDGINQAQSSQGVPRFAIGGFGDHPLADDPKQLIMDALVRSPAGAADALTTELPQSIHLLSPFGDLDSTNPIDILWAARWDDDGESFARVYTAAVDHLNAEAGYVDRPDAQNELDSEQLEARREASQLTYSVAEKTLDAPQDLDPMTEALAADLAEHHMADLHASAGELSGATSLGYVDDETGALNLHLLGERDLLAEIAEDSDADKRLLNGAAHYQAQLILEHTGDKPNAGNLAWSNNLAAFNGAVMSAHDLQLQHEFDSDNAKHDLVFKFVHGTVGLVSQAANVGIPGSGFVVDSTIDIFAAETEPSEELLARQQGSQDALVINSQNAAIAEGYHAHGLIPDPPGNLIASDGSVKAYTALTDEDDISDYARWMYEDDRTGRFVLPPRDHAASVMFEVSRILDHGD
jgi:hypothetical protein